MIDHPPLTRRLWTGVLLVNAFMVGMAALTLVQSRIQHERTAEERVGNLSSVLAQSLASALSRIDLTLYDAVDETESQLARGGIDVGKLEQFLAKRLTRMPELSALRFSDATGMVRLGAGTVPTAQISIADRGYFIRLRDDARVGLSVSRPVVGRIQRDWMLILARRVNNPDASFGGVVFATLTLEKIANDFFAPLSLGAHGLVTLWDQNLTIIARRPEYNSMGSVIGQKASMPGFLQLVRLGKDSGSFSGMNPRDGVERLYFYRKIPGFPFSITVGLSPVDYLADWHRQVYVFGGLTLLFTLVTLAAAKTIHGGWKRQGAAVRALEYQEEKFRALVENTDDWIWETDAHCRYTYVSPRVTSLLGFPPEEMIGKGNADLLPPEEAARFETALDPAVKSLAAFRNVEVITRRQDGEEVVLESSGTPYFDRSGQLAGYRGITRDVTERARMLEALVQSEKMVSVGCLASGVAHEINNPLGGILQSAQVLERRLAGEGAANERAASEAGCSLGSIKQYLRARDVPQLLEAIRDSASRAAGIVNNMLELSRRGGSSHEPASLEAILDKAVEMCLANDELDAKYGFRSIRIERDYDPAMPEVICSSMQLEQVFMNLLVNAAQAMAESPDPGRLPVITLRIGREGADAKVEVEDNGPGMDEDTRKRVCEPFFTTRATGKGTGLGLSVAYFVVTRMHGGSIRALSKPGQGTRFVITLPAWSSGATAESGDVGGE